MGVAIDGAMSGMVARAASFITDMFPLIAVVGGLALAFAVVIFVISIFQRD